MDALPIDRRITLPARDLSWTAVRASGAGGQNVNKVASKVELRFDLAGTTVLDGAVKVRLARLAKGRLDADGRIVIVRQRHRDQARNIEDAREALAELVRAALVRPKKRRPTRPTRASKERRLEAKKARGATKRSRRAPIKDD